LEHGASQANATINTDGDANNLGRLGDLLRLRKLVDALYHRHAESAPCKESRHAIEPELTRSSRPSAKPLSSSADSVEQIDAAARIAAVEISRASSHACSKTSRRWRHAMNERVKITPSHLARHAIVYLRQSSAAQVEHNRESTDRQYALANKRATSAGPMNASWSLTRILAFPVRARWRVRALPASPRGGACPRGLVLGLEVSRLARNNAEWYRLIDLAGFTDTLIGDADGIYHPPCSTTVSC